MDKAPDAFRTISEVADDLKVPQHVLRFWESRFSQIKPMKRAGGRRYYRPDDVGLLRGIHHLLYGEGYTIRGVQRILKEQGVKFVETVWQEGAEQPPHGPMDEGSLDEDVDDSDAEDEDTEGDDDEPAPRPVPRKPSKERREPVLSAPPPNAGLKREDLRNMQAALFELIECRRLLDTK